MGGALIFKPPAKIIKSPFDVAVEAAYPTYFVRDVIISTEDMEGASSSWQIIMHGENTSPFLAAHKDPDFKHSSVLTWFFDSFYERFFVLSPEARPMFTHISISAQGRLLAGVISSALGLLRNKDKLRQRLESMTKKHSIKGVKASQYGTMGSALIWGMELVLGHEFSSFHQRSWIRVFSFLLSVIVPIAVGFEMHGRMDSARSSSASYSDTARGIREVIETRLFQRQKKLDSEVPLKDQSKSDED